MLSIFQNPIIDSSITNKNTHNSSRERSDFNYRFKREKTRKKYCNLLAKKKNKNNFIGCRL